MPRLIRRSGLYHGRSARSAVPCRTGQSVPPRPVLLAGKRLVFVPSACWCGKAIAGPVRACPVDHGPGRGAASVIMVYETGSSVGSSWACGAPRTALPAPVTRSATEHLGLGGGELLVGQRAPLAQVVELVELIDHGRSLCRVACCGGGGGCCCWYCCCSRSAMR